MRHKLLHPIKSANDGKEIKKLKEDIAAFEKDKEDKGILLVAVGILCVLMVMLFATSLFGKSSNNKADETPVAMTVPEAKTETMAEAKTEKPIESTKEVPAVIEEEQASVDSSKDSSISSAGEETNDSEEGDDVVNETTEQETEEIDVDDEPIEQGLLASKIEVRYLLDYAHAKKITADSIYLGNDEGITLTIVTENKVNDIEELVFDYDTSLLNHTILEFDYEDGKTTIIAYVTALKECDAELYVTTEYELENKGDEADWYGLKIRKLDSSEGKVVYVTDYGEKYHYSAACAGENAIKTTRYDAEMLEKGPCGKCVN